MDIGSGGSWMSGGWKLSSLMRRSLDINDSVNHDDIEDDSTGNKMATLAQMFLLLICQQFFMTINDGPYINDARI